MASGNRFRDLRVWNAGMDLTRFVYAITGQFPAREQFGLAAQMRRAAVSVVSNIAEGHSRPRRTDMREFRRFVSIALGSAAELDTQIEVAADQGYAHASQLRRAREMVDEVSRMLRRLYVALSR